MIAMDRTRVFICLVAALLVTITLPVFLTVSGLSIMSLDAGGDSIWPWLFIGGVWGTSLIVPSGSLVGAVLLIRRKKVWAGLAVSLIPMVVLAIGWMWLSQQSFT